MAPKKRITEEQKALMKLLYVKALLSCDAIAERLQVSRQSVYNILKRMGIDISKRKMVVPCTECGQLVDKTRGEVRKHEKHFCDMTCYKRHLNHPDTQAEIFQQKKIRKEAHNLLPNGYMEQLYFYKHGRDTLVFDSREHFLEWKRTGLPMDVMVLKTGKLRTVTY